MSLSQEDLCLNFVKVRFDGFMDNWIKELLSSADARIKTPVIGSIVLVFLLFNWREVYFLLFSEETVT